MQTDRWYPVSATRLAALPGAQQRGFTLLELMIVVAVIAILASIAYPSYQDSVIKTRRGTAAGCLMEQAQFMERYYTTNMSYEDAALPQTSCRTDLAGFYTFGFTAAPTAAAFALQAVPSSRQKDNRCGTLNINQAGTRGASKGTAANCFP